MSKADNVALSHRWFEEVWNRKRIETVDELMASNAIIHGLGEDGADLKGPTPFKGFHQKFTNAFPDLRITIHDVLSDGDQTATRFSFRATHRGDGLGIPATGRVVNVTGMAIVRWRDGQAVEAWNEFDAAGMLKQLSAPFEVKLRV